MGVLASQGAVDITKHLRGPANKCVFRKTDGTLVEIGHFTDANVAMNEQRFEIRNISRYMPKIVDERINMDATVTFNVTEWSEDNLELLFARAAEVDGRYLGGITDGQEGTLIFYIDQRNNSDNTIAIGFFRVRLTATLNVNLGQQGQLIQIPFTATVLESLDDSFGAEVDVATGLRPWFWVDPDAETADAFSYGMSL